MRIALILVAIYMCGIGQAHAQDPHDRYESLIIPEKVTLGMSRGEVQPARPEAKEHKMATSSRNTKAEVLSELMGEGAPSVSYQYYFIEDRLRAVIKAIGHGDKRDALSAKRIHNALEKELVKLGEELILRLYTSLVQLPAELWKDEKDGTCVYFVDAPNETTVIVFDPTYFGIKDFFITSDEIPKVNPAVENMQKQMERIGVQ